MARTANAKSLRQLIKFHLLTVGVLAATKDVIASVAADPHNEYTGFGKQEGVQVAQLRKLILTEVGVKVPEGRGRMSLEERATIEAAMKKPAVGNKLRGMRQTLATKLKKIDKAEAAELAAA